jgi:phage-related minor tail protein
VRRPFYQAASLNTRRAQKLRLAADDHVEWAAALDAAEADVSLERGRHAAALAALHAQLAAEQATGEELRDRLQQARPPASHHTRTLAHACVFSQAQRENARLHSNAAQLVADCECRVAAAAASSAAAEASRYDLSRERGALLFVSLAGPRALSFAARRGRACTGRRGVRRS